MVLTPRDALSIVEPFGLRAAITDDLVSVELSPTLEKWDVLDAMSAQVGVVYGSLLLGWCGPDVSIEDKRIRVGRKIQSTADVEQHLLPQIHGIFALITDARIGRYLYPDCGSSIPLVYDETTRLVGGSADQILDSAEYKSELVRDRVTQMVTAEGTGGWISGSLTAHTRIRRLLPNHCLDLETFAAHRFWPRRDTFNFDRDVDDAAGDIAERLQGYLRAAVQQHSIAVTLTAGFDSRILLAASREMVPSTSFVTFRAEKLGLDQVISAELARRRGLRHRLQPIILASESAQQRWDRMVGHAIREVNRASHPTLSVLPEDMLITGMYGETGRCRLYRHDLDTVNHTPVTPDLVVSRLTLPRHPDLLEDIDNWLREVSWLPTSAVLDLAFNELRFGSWAMGQGPVQKSLKPSLMPFAQWAIQDQFMSIRPESKRTETLFNMIAAELWPEVLEIPVNRYGDYRDRFTRIRKVADREAVVRFLRSRRPPSRGRR